MINFPDFTQSENMGGIFDQFMFIERKNITTLPLVVSNKFITPPVTTSWLKGKSIMDSLQWEPKSETTNAGNYFQNSLKGAIPKITAEYLALFEEMKESEFLVIIRDNNNQYIMLGNLIIPLKFRYEIKPSTLPSGTNGYTFEFYNQTSFTPVFL